MHSFLTEKIFSKNDSPEDFGIKSGSMDNKYKQILLKTAFSSSDKEAQSYCEIIEALKKIIRLNK